MLSLCAMIHGSLFISKNLRHCHWIILLWISIVDITTLWSLCLITLKRLINYILQNISFSSLSFLRPTCPHHCHIIHNKDVNLRRMIILHHLSSCVTNYYRLLQCVCCITVNHHPYYHYIEGNQYRVTSKYILLINEESLEDWRDTKIPLSELTLSHDIPPWFFTCCHCNIKETLKGLLPTWWGLSNQIPLHFHFLL